MRRILLQQIGFQLVWLLCAFGGASGRSWPGVAAAASFLVWSFATSHARWRDLALVGGAVGFGALLDAALVGAGWVTYTETSWRLGTSPAWILALWAAFAPTVPGAFGWLRGRPALGAPLGALGGVLAYAAGERIGALALAASSEIAWSALALAWAVALPALVAGAARLEDSSGPSARAAA